MSAEQPHRTLQQIVRDLETHTGRSIRLRRLANKLTLRGGGGELEYLRTLPHRWQTMREKKNQLKRQLKQTESQIEKFTLKELCYTGTKPTPENAKKLHSALVKLGQKLAEIHDSGRKIVPYGRGVNHFDSVKFSFCGDDVKLYDVETHEIVAQSKPRLYNSTTWKLAERFPSWLVGNWWGLVLTGEDTVARLANSWKAYVKDGKLNITQENMGNEFRATNKKVIKTTDGKYQLLGQDVDTPSGSFETTDYEKEVQSKNAGRKKAIDDLKDSPEMLDKMVQAHQLMDKYTYHRVVCRSILLFYDVQTEIGEQHIQVGDDHIGNKVIRFQHVFNQLSEQMTLPALKTLYEENLKALMAIVTSPTWIGVKPVDQTVDEEYKYFMFKYN